MNTTTTGVLLIKAERGTRQSCQGDQRAQFARSRQAKKDPGQGVNRAGPFQRRAEHEHAADHDRRAVAENRQRFLSPENASHQQQPHRGERDKIRRKPLSQERYKDQHYEPENNDQMK